MNIDQRIIDKFLADHPDIAQNIIEQWETEAIISLMETLSNHQNAVILTSMVPYRAGKTIQKISAATATELLELLPLRVSTRLLPYVDKSIRNQLLAGTKEEIAQHLQRSLKYSKESVGAHMEPAPVTFTVDQTAGDALATVKKDAEKATSSIFVVDRDSKLAGCVELKSLLVADPEILISTLAQPAPPPVLVGMEIHQILLQWNHELPQLPVIDSEGVFIGVVSRSASEHTAQDKKKQDHSVLDAGRALGELYLIGLSGLLGGSGHTNHSTP